MQDGYGGWVHVYVPGVGRVGTCLGTRGYLLSGTGFGLLAGPRQALWLSLDWPWLYLLEHLRLSSHRILPVSPRVSNMHVSANMNGAVPRSQF